MPNYAQRMPDELIEKLFVEFKNDKLRWDEFEKREWQYVKEGVEALPGRAMIVHKFVEEKLGSDHPYYDAELILKIRETIRPYKKQESILEKLQRLVFGYRSRTKHE